MGNHIEGLQEVQNSDVHLDVVIVDRGNVMDSK